MVTPTALDVSVVICAYTEARWEELIACVQSVQRQTVPCKEIIVVVDYNPRLLDRACVQFPGVMVIPNREPRGLAGARNTGVAAAAGDVIAFIDEDAVAAPDWLSRLGERYGDPRVLGVGGAILPVWQVTRPRWFPDEFLWVVGCTYRGMPVTTAPVRNLIGCNMSFRRAAFDLAGGFTNGLGGLETLPFGCEETEFCIRARQQLPDRELLYQPDAVVHHRVPRVRATRKYFLARCASEGRSKAMVARLVGSERALESERAFVVKTLTRGIAAGLVESAARRGPDGALRALAIVAGLAWTAIGYFRGEVTDRHATQR